MTDSITAAKATHFFDVFRRGRRLWLFVALAAACLSTATRSQQPRSSGTVETTRTTNAGPLTITRYGPAGRDPTNKRFVVALGGQSVFVVKNVASVSIYACFGQTGSGSKMGDIVVLSIAPGGNACPAMFRVLQLRSAKKHFLTPEFGDCSDIPTVRQQADRVILTFPGFYHLHDAQRPGFRPPPSSTYVHQNGGRLTKKATTTGRKK